MLTTLVRSASLALSGIIAGLYVRDNISYAGVKRLPGPHYARYHQELDRDFAKAMPFVGGMSLLASLATVAVPQPGRRRALSAVALGCGLTEVALTLAWGVPLNKQVQTWSVEAPPAEWAAVRDRWMVVHRLRTGIGLIGLGCQIAATMRP